MKKEQNVYTLVSAVAKGFLVRHLLCSVKVKEIVRTIKVLNHSHLYVVMHVTERMPALC